jgi:tetratricopeptide (TPR) repeat protein
MALATPILRAALVLCIGSRLLVQSQPALADPATADPGSAAFAQRAFAAAQAQYGANPRDAGAALKFGQACFELAEFATNKTERASLANQGIAACQTALARQPDSAPGHYYLGLNLGQLARTKGVSALKIVPQMEQEFKRALTLDAQLDWAGADRNLGLLYFEAPAIASIGSRAKARAHFTHAVELAPAYPGNRLNLIEAYVQWRELDNARSELTALEAAWPSARTNFIGEAWQSCWADWEPRLKQLRKRIETKSKAIEAPRTRP